MFTRFKEKPRLLWLCLILMVLHYVLFVDAQLSPFPMEKILQEGSKNSFQLASNQAQGLGYSSDGKTPSVAIEPGYPSFLTIFTSWGGVLPGEKTAKNLAPVIAVQIFLFGVACYLMAHIASQLFGSLPGAMTALFLQLYWPISKFQHQLVPEWLLFVAIAMAWTLISKWGLSPQFRFILPAGILLGFAAVIYSP